MRHIEKNGFVIIGVGILDVFMLCLVFSNRIKPDRDMSMCGRGFGGWRDAREAVVDVGVDEIERDWDAKQAGEPGQLVSWRFVGRVVGVRREGTQRSVGRTVKMHLRDVSGRYIRLVLVDEGATNLWDVDLGDYIRAVTVFVRDSHPHSMPPAGCRCKLFSHWSNGLARLSGAPPGISIGLVNVGISMKQIYKLPYPEIQVGEIGPLRVLRVETQGNGDGLAMLVRDELGNGLRGQGDDAWNDVEICCKCSVDGKIVLDD